MFDNVKLRDLGDIVRDIQNRVNSEFSDEDVKLSKGFKSAFSKHISSGGNQIKYHDTTSIITTSTGLDIYLPNQWFGLAAYAVDLVKEIVRYRTITEATIDANIENLAIKAGKTLDKQVIYRTLKEDKSSPITKVFEQLLRDHLAAEGQADEDIEDNTKYLLKFVSDNDWWLGGKGIERTDYYVSPVLKLLNLVNVSQSYVADITYAYATNDELYKELPSMTDASDDDEIDEENILSRNAVVNFKTGYDSPFARNRIVFGAPGTGKSFQVNEDRKKLLGEYNETDYERVTFHPDYSYANFVGTYKPVMVSSSGNAFSDKETENILSVLTDESKTAQEKYDLLFDFFKGEGLTRLPILLGLYTDETFKTRKMDGTAAVGDNSVERNHGRAIRKYVNLITDKNQLGDIAYKYVPGPFMRVYVNALKSTRDYKPRPHLLIIEEINRADMAAVFGDIFQLLDRVDNVSEYPIQASEDIKKHLAEELGGNPEDYSKIKIPDNMFIWATMNSADQGVFPMDTAFKRRWDFTYIGIDDNDKDIRGKYVILGKEPSQKVEWNKLRKAINNFLTKQKINEDKQLGPYFISRKIVVPAGGDEIDSDAFIETFKNKVLMYLFEDAAKQKRSTLFEGCFENSRRYSEICREFEEKGIGIFNHEIILDTEAEDFSLSAATETETFGSAEE